MADVDIHRLCTLCDDLPPEDAEPMDIYLYPLLNPSILALHDDPIYRSIKAIDGECERLECMAAFYSWLLPRSPHTAWAIYSVHRIFRCWTRRKLHSSWRERCGRLIKVWRRRSPTRIMPGARSLAFQVHIPISINVWHGLPFVAMLIQDMTGPDASNWPLLESVVGDLEKRFYGFYSYLTSARSAAAI
ncbi:hypothetical protein MTO96_045998 [Rhipicephalus appendiculatus]